MDPHANECCAAIIGMQELYGVENRPHPDQTRRTAAGRKLTAADRCSIGREARRHATCSADSRTASLRDAQSPVGVV
jgi:hypothetical protein